MKPENKRSLPEIELALIFMAIVFIVQLCILAVVLWNSHQDRKIIQGVQSRTSEYRLLDDQYRQMQVQYTSIKSSMDNIIAAVADMEEICQGKNPTSQENSVKLKSLKQVVQYNKINLDSEMPLAKLVFGASAGRAFQKYLADLEGALAATNICSKGLYSRDQWKKNSDSVSNQLTQSLSRVSDAMSRVLQKPKAVPQN